MAPKAERYYQLECGLKDGVKSVGPPNAAILQYLYCKFPDNWTDTTTLDPLTPKP